MAAATARSPELIVAGLGPAGLALLSGESLRCLESAGHLVLRTERHPAAVELRERGIPFTALDSLYEQAESFPALYSRLAEAVLREAEAGKGSASGPVVYAVPGNPLLGEESVRRLLPAAAEAGLAVRVLPAPGFVDVVAPALAAAGELPDLVEWQVADGAALERVWWEPGRPTLVFQVDDAPTASRVKLALLEEYPADCEVCVVRHAGDPARESVTRLPLFQLDRPEAGAYDHLSTLYLPPLPPARRRPGFAEFVDVIAHLRSPEGCPWDREQDYRSLRRYTLEEAYEVLEAVEGEDPEKLCEELGDLMLQVLMYAQIAREAGSFEIRDVIAGVVEKLIRRHPHVFGDAAAHTAEEVVRTWEGIKQQEKPERASVLDGVPRELPALMKALEVSKRAVRAGFEWPDLDGVLAKLDEEIGELKAELPQRDPEKLRAELGDLFFTLVNVARWLKLDPEESLREMVDRFSRRFREVERLAAAAGRDLSTLDPAALDRLWEQAKQSCA